MGERRMIIAVDIEQPHDPRRLDDIVKAVRDAIPMDLREDGLVRLAIREVADEVIAVFEEDARKMGMVKHGQGRVLPENEQQKQGSQEGLTTEAVDEIVAEGHEDVAADE